MTPEQVAALVGFLVAAASIPAAAYFVYRIFSKPWDKTMVKKHGTNDLTDRAPRPADPPPQVLPVETKTKVTYKVDLSDEKVEITQPVSNMAPGTTVVLRYSAEEATAHAVNILAAVEALKNSKGEVTYEVKTP